MAKSTQPDIQEAVPERTQLPQPKRVITPPLPPGTRNTNSEPDTSQSVRGRQIEGTDPDSGAPVRGEIPAARFTRSVAEQLAEGAAANDTPLSPQGITTTASLHGDPHEVQPRFTDPRTQAPPPVREAPREELRTRIQVGPIDEVLVSEEQVVRVRPKFTGSRWIGPYRYYFTKDVVCEVPKSVRAALLREDLAYPYYE
jgi:hypothetical protein